MEDESIDAFDRFSPRDSEETHAKHRAFNSVASLRRALANLDRLGVRVCPKDLVLTLGDRVYCDDRKNNPEFIAGDQEWDSFARAFKDTPRRDLAFACKAGLRLNSTLEYHRVRVVPDGFDFPHTFDHHANESRAGGARPPVRNVCGWAGNACCAPGW